MVRPQTQEWVRFVQVKCSHVKDLDAGVGELCAGWCKHEKDSDARLVVICAGLMLVWEGFRRRSGRGLCRFDARMIKIQTQDWVKFAAGLMQAWEGFRRNSGCRLCRFDACMRRIQTQEWARFVQVWCTHDKDSDAGVGEVCASLMQAWDGFRRRSGWNLCRFSARMRRIQTQEWVRFVQVFCSHVKVWDAGLSEVCAGLMQAWEGFRRKSVCGLCRFDACMRRIQTQEWARFVQAWCTHDNDSDAGVGEVCAGLMQAWDGFRRSIGRCLCRFYARMRRIKTQEWVRFVQVWCRHEIDSNAGVLMFVQVWCTHDKDSDAGVRDDCAGLIHTW